MEGQQQLTDSLHNWDRAWRAGTRGTHWLMLAVKPASSFRKGAPGSFGH
jgi:hypothetical protein